MKHALILGIALIGVLFVSGCIGLPPKSELDVQNQPLPHADPTLTCEQDLDCIYAVNAYYAPRCVSGNCPPEEQAQPTPKDPAYQWEDGFRAGCIYAGFNDGKDALGEKFQTNPRKACACVSLTNTVEKICQPV